jgi:hypothetical protein
MLRILQYHTLTLVVCVGSRASAVGSTAITDCLCAVNTYAASGSNNNTGACTACVNNGAQRITAGSIAAASCLCPSLIMLLLASLVMIPMTVMLVAL